MPRYRAADPRHCAMHPELLPLMDRSLYIAAVILHLTFSIFLAGLDHPLLEFRGGGDGTASGL